MLQSAVIEDLERVIRQIEVTTGKATQLVAVVGDQRYVLGSLVRRAGPYRLVMNDTYQDVHQGEVKNPFVHLTGDFLSFVELGAAVESSGRLKLVGSLELGYSVCLPSVNIGRAGGQQYGRAGKIIYPLLKPDERPGVMVGSNVPQVIA